MPLLDPDDDLLIYLTSQKKIGLFPFHERIGKRDESPFIKKNRLYVKVGRSLWRSWNPIAGKPIISILNHS